MCFLLEPVEDVHIIQDEEFLEAVEVAILKHIRRIPLDIEMATR